MYASSTFVFAILALVRIAIATPPACLIDVMGVQPNPADLKSLCGTLEPQVAGNITQKCSGADQQAAISIYASTCLSAESVTISIATSSSTSASASGTGKSTLTTATSTSAKATGTASITSGSGSATATGSSTGTGTAAGSTTTKASSAGSIAPQFVLAILAAGFAGQYLL